MHHLLKKKKFPPQYYQRPSSHNLAHLCKISDIACGYGFSLFAVKKDKVRLLGCGISTDGQIGYQAPRRNHPLGMVQTASPIQLPIDDDTKVIRVAAGRAHSLVLTDSQGLFTLGNNAYGQCARAVVPGEDYASVNNLYNVKHLGGQRIVDVCCGQDHSLMLTEDGGVWACGWGADGQTGQGHFEASVAQPRAVATGDVAGERIVKVASKGDFVLALNDKGEVFGWGNNEYKQIVAADILQINTPVHLKQLQQVAGRIVDIGAGGSFAIAVNECGSVFVWGFGLLGGGPQLTRAGAPQRLPATLFGGGEGEGEVQQVGCGLFCMSAVTRLGHLYMWGRNKGASLGLGHTNDQYFPFKVAVGAEVLKVATGVDHTLALCKPFA